MSPTGSFGVKRTKNAGISISPHPSNDTGLRPGPVFKVRVFFLVKIPKTAPKGRFYFWRRRWDFSQGEPVETSIQTSRVRHACFHCVSAPPYASLHLPPEALGNVPHEPYGHASSNPIS